MKQRLDERSVKPSLLGTLLGVSLAHVAIVSCGSHTPPASKLAADALQAPTNVGSRVPPPGSAAPSGIDARQNWLVNGTFEEADWDDWENARSAFPGRASSHALVVKNRAPTWNSASQWIRFDTNQTSPKEIVVSGWIRTEGVIPGDESWMRARVVVDFAGPDGKQVGGWQSAAVLAEGDSEWTHFEHAYPVPDGACSVKLEAGLPNIVGSAWYDDLAMVLVDPDGSRRIDARPRVQRTDVSDWYAYTAPKSPDGAALDLSYLNEKPAGKRGHVRVLRGHFGFEDGTPVRFWGTNLVGDQAFPTHEVATATARRLARLGVNLVRLHHMDADWAKPNIFDSSADNTQRFSEESLDRLDYLIAELKENGIYVYPDLLVHRKYKRGDGVIDYEGVERGAKGLAHFSRRIIELNELYARTLLSHKNKYTGMSLAEDPAMVGTEMVNESSIFVGFHDEPYPAAYEQELQHLYATQGGKGKISRFAFDWGKDRLAVSTNPENAAESLRFLASTTDKTNAEMKSYLQSIGVKALLTGSNIGLPIEAEIRANAKTDFLDTHHYWDHPQVWKMAGGWDEVDRAPFDNKAQLRDPAMAGPGRLALWAVKDKPILVTEWNDCFPNEQRLEGPVLMAAYGSLQDWDGLLQFDYRHGVPGSERIRQSGIQTRPDNEALFEMAALVFRRRYLAPSPREVVDEIDDVAALGVPSRSPLLVDEPWLPYAARVVKRFVGSERPRVESLEPLRGLHDATAKTIRSATGQISWHYGNAAVLTIDSPKVQGFTGDIATRGARLETRNLAASVDARNPWASLSVVSLDDKPISEASRLLLVAVARAENTGQTYNMSRNALKSTGTTPVLMQGVRARITLKQAKNRTFTVKPLDADGQAGAALDVHSGSNGLQGTAVFSIGPEQRTALYLLTAH